jgi:hypothetical protein
VGTSLATQSAAQKKRGWGDQIMFAVLIVVSFLSGLAGLLALMSRLEPVDAPAVATSRATRTQGADVVDHPRAA